MPDPNPAVEIGTLVAARVGAERIHAANAPALSSSEGFQAGDIIVLGTRVGDGHVTSELDFDSALTDQVRSAFPGKLKLVHQIRYGGASVTIYWEAPLYNALPAVPLPSLPKCHVARLAPVAG